MSSRKRAAQGSRGTPTKIRATGDAATQIATAWAQHVISKVNEATAKLGSLEFVHPVEELVKLYGNTETGQLGRKALWREMVRLLTDNGHGGCRVDIPAVGESDLQLVPPVGTELTLKLPMPYFVLNKHKVQNVTDTPVFTQWSNFLTDILSENYQHREPFRVCMLKPDATHITPGSLDFIQGFTRMSIVMFVLKNALEYVSNSENTVSEAGMELLRGCPNCIPLVSKCVQSGKLLVVVPDFRLRGGETLSMSDSASHIQFQMWWPFARGTTLGLPLLPPCSP